jgi:hypothetical protein
MSKETHFYNVASAPRFQVRLVTSEAEYLDTLDAFEEVNFANQWMDDSYAAVYPLEVEGSLFFIVGLNKKRISEENVDGIDIAGFLAHEAVHVKQRIMAHLYEREPSKEFEAYCVQNVFSSLMEQYKETLFPLPPLK